VLRRSARGLCYNGGMKSITHQAKNICLALAILGPLIAGEHCHGQGTFIFQNFGWDDLNAPVFDGGGNPLYGTNYVALLYGGPTVDMLAPATMEHSASQAMPPVPFTVPLAPFGYFSYDKGWVEIPSVPCAGYAWLQVRAWDARLGSSYENVATLGLGGYGESKLFQAQGGGPCGNIAIPPNPLRGLESFSLRPAPEPTALLILLLGLPSLLWHRRGPQ